MSTWTSRVFLGCLAACAAACVPVPEEGDGAKALKEPLTSAKLSRGLSVAAPDGFCIDATSLSRDFALLARCDRLGADGGAGAPLAVIAVSVPRVDGASDLPDPESLVGGQEALLDSYRSADLQLVKVAGEPPAEGLSGRYWRGAGLVGQRVLGVAMYPKANGPSLDREAVDLLVETFKRSEEMSRNGVKIESPDPETPATEAPKKEPRGLFAGLFK